MAVIFNGTNQYLFLDRSALPAAKPWSISCAVRLANTTQTAMIVGCPKQHPAGYGGGGYACEMAAVAAADDYRISEWNNNAGEAWGYDYARVAGMSTAWRGLAGVVEDSYRRLWAGGVAGVPDTAPNGWISGGPPTILTVGIQRYNLTPDLFYPLAGSVCALATFAGRLADAEAARLSSFQLMPWEVRSARLLHWWPLVGGYARTRDMVAGLELAEMNSPQWDNDLPDALRCRLAMDGGRPALAALHWPRNHPARRRLAATGTTTGSAAAHGVFGSALIRGVRTL